MRHALFILIAALFFTSGCKEETFTPVPDGRTYFPLVLGQTLEYKVDSIIFDDISGGNSQDTLSGFILEEVVDSFRSTSSDVIYVVRRSFRRAESDNWVVTSTWSQQTDAAYAYRQEGSLKHVKMRFPLKDISEWDPTALFDPSISVPVGTEEIEMYSDWYGEVTGIDKAESIGGMQFDSVMTCLQANNDNEIERRYSLEKYATGVGLVLRIDTILDSRCKRLGDLTPCLDETWSEKGEKGYILRQELVRFN